MNADENKLHVIPLQGHWEVEDQSGMPLAQETNVEDAIRDARVIAEQAHIGKIILHDGEGVTEDIEIVDPDTRRPSVVPPAEEA
ncbi:hypothetical protein BH09VER1_BH09VER1_01250 [soil metagenome]